MNQLWKRSWAYGLFIISFILAGSCTAFGDPCQLESITVTADKRAENIQKVPMAISAFTGAELEDAGIETVPDVVRMIPGLNMNVEAPMWHGVSYRGIGVSTFTAKNPVVIFMDGIPLDSRTDWDSDLFNVERVEFLRGPQGTLYGKSAIAGVINIISKKPDNRVSSQLTGKWGENDTYGIKGFVNCPLIKDKLFLGLSATYDETGGYMTNDHPGEDYFDHEQRKTAKALVRWFPSDQLELTFRGGVDQTENGTGPSIGGKEVRYHETRNPDDKSDSHGFDSALNVSYRGQLAQFNSVTTFRETDIDFRQDNTFVHPRNLGRFSDTQGQTFTQEFRLQSLDSADGIKWIAGLFYSDENSRADEFGVASKRKYSMKFDWPYDLDEKTMAAFGQATIPLTSALDFTAGLRYEKTEKALDYKGTVTRMDTGQVTSNVQWEREEDWDALLPKGVLSWTVNPDAMVYFSVAQGYLAGGLNKTFDDRDRVKFDEETALNYEIGAKTAWMDNRLIVNATLFYVDIEDMHVYSQPQPGIFVASNAAKAHSQGIEIEAKARPFQGLDITGAFSWIDAEFDEYKHFEGNTPTFTPEYTLFLSAQYRHETGFFIRGEMEGYGETFYDAGNKVRRDPMELFNAKIGYETGSWDIYAYADNLFDKEYFTRMSSRAGNMVGAPRTLGVMASIRF